MPEEKGLKKLNQENELATPPAHLSQSILRASFCPNNALQEGNIVSEQYFGEK